MTTDDAFSMDRSFEELRRNCCRVRAALTTLPPALEGVASSWEKAADDTLAVHVASLKAEDDHEAAYVVERLAAYAWDRAVDALAAQSLARAGGDATRAPHVDLFGVIAAEDVKRLGSAKASIVGRELLTNGRRLIERDAANLPIGAALAELEAATGRLEAAESARARDSEQRLAFMLAKAQLVRRLQRLADETRLLMLRALPGRADLVVEVLDRL